MCRYHGGAARHVIRKARERIERILLPKAVIAAEDALDQREHWPTTLNAAKEILDRTLGPVRGGKEEGASQPVIQIGIAFASDARPDTTPVIDVTPVKRLPERTES